MLSARTEPIWGRECVSGHLWVLVRLLCRNDDPAEIQGASRNWLREERADWQERKSGQKEQLVEIGYAGTWF